MIFDEMPGALFHGKWLLYVFLRKNTRVWRDSETMCSMKVMVT